MPKGNLDTVKSKLVQKDGEGRSTADLSESLLVPSLSKVNPTTQQQKQHDIDYTSFQIDMHEYGIKEKKIIQKQMTSLKADNCYLKEQLEQKGREQGLHKEEEQMKYVLP